MIKKLMKFLGIVFFALVLALAILPFVFEEEIKEGIKQAINEEVNAHVEFQDINLSFFRSFPDASVRIDQLQVTGIESFINDTLASTKQIDLAVSIPSIIKKSQPILIKEINVEEASINLKVDELLNNNFLIFKDGEQSTSYTLELKKYTISDSRLTYIDKSNGVDITINNIDHSGKGRFTESIFDLDTRTTSNDISVKRNGVPLLTSAEVEADAIIEVVLKERKYTFRDNSIIINALPLMMDGYIQLPDEGTAIHLDFQAIDADFKKVFSLIPYAYTEDYKDAQITGSGTIEASINGLMASDNSSMPVITMNLNVMDGSIKYPLLPAAIEDISTTASIKASGVNYDQMEVDIPSIQLKSRESKLSGRLNIKGQKDNQSIDMGLTANVDLQTWKDAFPMKGTTAFQGSVKSDLTLKGNTKDISNKNWSKVIFNGYLNGENILVQSNEGPTLAVRKLTTEASPRLLDVNMEGFVYERSDFDVELQLTNPLTYITEKSINGSTTISSNKINTEDFLNNTSNSSADSTFIIPDINMEVKCYAQQVLYPGYNINNLMIEGKIDDDIAIIDKFQASVNDQQFNGRGNVKGINDYLNQQGELKGNINISAPSVNTSAFINSESKGASSRFKIPELIDIEITSNIGSLDHGPYQLKNIQAQASLSDGTLKIREFESSTLGGKIIAAGSYSTYSEKNDEFDFKVDLSEIGFQNAVKASPLFRYLAPVADYITGYFNATLMMNSEVGLDLVPVYNTLDASGYIETREGKIQGYQPLVKLANKIGVEKISDWAIENSKNWFEVVDGMVELKDHRFELGQGLAITVGGRHGLGRNMNYNMILELPRSLLKRNAVTGTIEFGLSQVEAQAAKLGVDISQGDNLLFNINMTGRMDDPSFKITPLGSIDRGLDEIADEKLKEKISEMEDKINTQIESTSSTVKDSIEKVSKKATDSITQVVTKGAETVKDSIGKVIDNVKSKAVDSLLNKTGLDSLNNKPVDILKDKAGKEIEDIKKKLDKWKPFSKKQKTKKDTVPKGGK
jgi:hypothetical protein